MAEWPTGPCGAPTAMVAAWEPVDDRGPPECPPEVSQDTEDSSSQSCPTWLLKVTVLGASGLRRTDWGPGQSADPYCLVSVPGKPGLCFRTPTIPSTVTPVWKHECLLSGWEDGDSLDFIVNDRDRFTKDDRLGCASLPSDSFYPNGFSGEIPLLYNGSDAGAELEVAVEVVRQSSDFQMHGVWENRSNMSMGQSGSSLDVHMKAGQSMTHAVESVHTHQRRSEQLEGSPCMLDPSSIVRIGWDVVGVFILALDLVWLPMQVFNPPEMTPMTVLQWVSVLYWSFDIFLSFNTGALSKEGYVIMDRAQVSRLYVRRWLIPDLLVVGLEWVFLVGVFDNGFVSDAASAARAGKVFRCVRIFRMLRLMRLVKMRELLFALQSYIESEIMTLAVMVSVNVLTIVALNHLLACGWFMVGNMSDFGWVTKAELLQGDFMVNYLISMQWSMAQFTPGSSKIHPCTVPERVYSLGVLVLGFVVATCFVSNITSTLSAVWSMKRNERTQSMLLKKFLKQNSISRPLASRVTRYIHCVKALRMKKVPPSHVQYLSFLSGPLNVELLCELRGPHLCNHSFFKEYKGSSKYAFRELCTAALEQISFARNDVVFVHKAESRHMYFLVNGSTVYRPFPMESDSGKSACLPRSRLEAGQWCCEIAIWIPWQHVGDMKALSDVDAMTLNAAKFSEVSCVDPHIYHLAREHGRHFVERAAQVASFGMNALTDLPWRVKIVAAEGEAPRELRNAESRITLSSAVRELQEAEDMQMEMMNFSDSENNDHNVSETSVNKNQSWNRRQVLSKLSPNTIRKKTWKSVTTLFPSSVMRGMAGFHRARTVA